MALTFDDAQAATLLELLGLPADTTDITTILDTLKDAVGDQPPSALAAAAQRAGLDVLDADTVAALKADAAEGRRLKAAAARQQVEDVVNAAICRGKITASRRKHWVDLIEADPGMADVLASVPDETALPLREIGHSIDSTASSGGADQPWFYS